MEKESNIMFYRHTKTGNWYLKVSECRHSETLEEMIVYRALYGDYETWVRPKSMFDDFILINGEKKPRFAKFSLSEVPVEVKLAVSNAILGRPTYDFTNIKGKTKE